jgi:hypothetical protein
MPVEMRLEFDEPAHAYTLNGKRVPGVTSVLEPLQKLDGIPPDVLAAAAEFGQHVHAACHLHNIGDLDWDSLDPRLALYVQGYLAFLEDTGFQVVHSEKRVGSVMYQYGGTLDLFGMLKRGKSMIDLKSTAALPRIVGPQTAAYNQALYETTGDKATRRYCLHLKPQGYKLVEQDNRQDFNTFLCALGIARWRAAAP